MGLNIILSIAKENNNLLNFIQCAIKTQLKDFKGRKRREVIEYNHEIKRLMYQEPETWRPYKTG